jgi:CRP-like cAMP-binding protein
MEASSLASLELVAAAEPDQLNHLASLLRPHRLAAGEVLMREGEAGDTFALVIDGALSIWRERSGEGREHLANSGRGAILGELALLRGKPRTATVVAETPSVVALGGPEALAVLLELPGVLERLRKLASKRLARDAQVVEARTARGLHVGLRPLVAEDRGIYTAAVQALSPESLRRRFFSPGVPSEALLDYLVDVDYVNHFAWLVLGPARNQDPRPPGAVAAGRYVRSPGSAVAEVAFGVADAYQGKGIGTLLLGAVACAADCAGVETLSATTLEDNAPMRQVFAKAGGSTSFAEPGVVRIDLPVPSAMRLLDRCLSTKLQAAVQDIVTAASLALS